MDPTYDRILGLQSISTSTIDELYSSGRIQLDSIHNAPADIRPHEKLVITNCTSSNSALALLDSSKEWIQIVKESKTWGIQGRNKEQLFLLKLLRDNTIRCQVVLGNAGTGKTLLVFASALSQVLEKKNYKKIVFTKPTYEVGTGPGLGTVPGDISEKFAPFLGSYDHIASELGISQFQQAQNNISFEPIQRMRGKSYIETLVVADEVQSLDRHEMQTLCTRIGKGSKLILMGDLQQIDRRIRLEDTGLYTLATSERIKDSPLCATVELVKNERSEISTLLNQVLSKTT